MRIGMVLEYDGGGFSGSQYQSGVRTVQSELEAAAKRIFQASRSRVRLASRTDAGVHATGQVASLDVISTLGVTEMRRAFNGNLEEDLRVRCLRRVPDDFEPRRHAKFREYVYVINDCEVPSPLRRRTEYHSRVNLDVDAMDAAARLYEGVHDFASFAASDGGEDAVTTRRISHASVVRGDSYRIHFTVRANAFLRQQIRRMVAVLIDVGRGAREVAIIEILLSEPSRGAASQTVPAKGLTLTRVGYGDRVDRTSLPSFVAEQTP